MVVGGCRSFHVLVTTDFESIEAMRSEKRYRTCLCNLLLLRFLVV